MTVKLIHVVAYLIIVFVVSGCRTNEPSQLNQPQQQTSKEQTIAQTDKGREQPSPSPSGKTNKKDSTDAKEEIENQERAGGSAQDKTCAALYELYNVAYNQGRSVGSENCVQQIAVGIKIFERTTGLDASEEEIRSAIVEGCANGGLGNVRSTYSEIERRVCQSGGGNASTGLERR